MLYHLSDMQRLYVTIRHKYNWKRFRSVEGLKDVLDCIKKDVNYERVFRFLDDAGIQYYSFAGSRVNDIDWIGQCLASLIPDRATASLRLKMFYSLLNSSEALKSLYCFWHFDHCRVFRNALNEKILCVSPYDKRDKIIDDRTLIWLTSFFSLRYEVLKFSFYGNGTTTILFSYDEHAFSYMAELMRLGADKSGDAQ